MLCSLFLEFAKFLPVIHSAELADKVRTSVSQSL